MCSDSVCKAARQWEQWPSEAEEVKEEQEKQGEEVEEEEGVTVVQEKFNLYSCYQAEPER